MTRKDSLRIGAYLLACTAIVAIAFAAGYMTRDLQHGDVGEDYPLVAEAQRILDSHYLGDTPSETERSYAIIRGLLDSYGDPYTYFQEPVQAQIESDNLSGTYGGIGSYLRRTPDGDLELEPFPDSPASEAGILVGDILLRVDDSPITPDMATDDIVGLLRGLEGTSVEVEIRTGDAPSRTVTVTRRQIPLPSVTSRILEEAPNIGHIRLTRFSATSADELTDAVTSLQDEGATEFVLDLRNNGGGLLSAAVDVADLFLENGIILYEQQLGENERAFQARRGDILDGAPLVVLVNGNSASASEILAGALRELGRAPLIGQTTFGKGVVQLIFQLSDGSSIHVTNARWYTPDRTDINEGGLVPDIEVVPDPDAIEAGRDLALERAITYLENLP